MYTVVVSKISCKHANLLILPGGRLTTLRLFFYHGFCGETSTPFWNTDLMGEIVISVQWETVALKS